ncbi:enoyl-ACP reductase FabI [Christiangramia forsetii]|uniref:Enoyl-[acyl-carrier-protein] reductase [NADH] 2 n=2 Tax=Christiangramia forsetii TaxID=411153 RepID=A0M1T7_CHRFK|nr:SDR family oxidoreductase [Christiangramia forsetii]GGG45393.1 short-chain dehydrogenase [Christiangramia forsetii]CAL66582.1 enoyl-[acyl-carrier-protein] reductase [NADH] 2 [Christiangramia forsetii KT0803]
MVAEFKDKEYWALILGGSSGLGYASAKKLAKHGMNIIIIHRDRRSEIPDIEEAFDEIRNSDVKFESFNADAVKKESREELILKIKDILGENGRIRTLLHSIAKGNLKPMTGDDNLLENIDFQLTIDAMALSLYDWAQAIFRNHLFAKDARVISFTSDGNKKAWKNYAAVSAAKVTLEALTRSMALEFARHGIRANCIQAGITVTRSFQMIPGNETLRVHALKHNPFRRLTVPDDVANAVYLLSKDEASWITGTIIPVNGGEHLM